MKQIFTVSYKEKGGVIPVGIPLEVLNLPAIDPSSAKTINNRWDGGNYERGFLVTTRDMVTKDEIRDTFQALCEMKILGIKDIRTFSSDYEREVGLRG